MDLKLFLLRGLHLNELRILLGSRKYCPGPEVMKLFSCSAQLSLKFILLINVKM